MKITHASDASRPFSLPLKSSLLRQNVAADATVDITSILSISSRECGNGTERERNKTEKISFRRLVSADSTARQIARGGRISASLSARQKTQQGAFKLNAR
jgi:hypothetical protein